MQKWIEITRLTRKHESETDFLRPFERPRHEKGMYFHAIRL